MLQQLHIQNYVLIEDLEMNVSNGLTIITGETGAGKTILLGALSLILGQRSDSSVLRDKNKKCIIEGHFDVSAYALHDFFSRHELDYEDISCLRREIGPDGKSRAFINDTPVNLNQLKEIGSKLVDIHSQHETLTLQDSGFQLSVVDASCGHASMLTGYRTGFTDWQKNSRKLEELREQEWKSKADQDYFQFQFNELEEATLRDGEEEDLQQELDTLSNAEEIKVRLNQVVGILREGDFSVLRQMDEAFNLLRNVGRFNAQVGQQIERLKSVSIETRDILSELESLEQHIQYDTDRIRQISDRLNQLNGLQQKHRVNSSTALIGIRNEFIVSLNRIQSLEDEIDSLKNFISEQEAALLKQAAVLSLNRKEALVKIEKETGSMLNDIGMPHAVLKVDLQDTGQLTRDGVDKVKFLFSANKGLPLQELSKVASGGELSRLMLCIKSLMARLVTMPTIVFDEIDTGISGEIAFKVGSIIEKMARKHQVIAITHLPQMASRGDSHFLVFKKVKGKTTHTGLRVLDQQERISEIAKMLSGDQLTDAALENAKELLAK